jgi:hypothetical protein
MNWHGAGRKERRIRRRGKGFLPPNNKQWDNEHNALDLREELNLSLNVPLHRQGSMA